MNNNQATVLGLRTVNAKRQSHSDFQWPKKGPVFCPDWDPKPECGNGLHALIKGEGDGSLLSIEPDAIWQVVEIIVAEIVDLNGKGKFPRCNVLYSGDRETAVALIQKAHPEAIVAYGRVMKGNDGKAITGYGGQATVGDYGQATAGNRGQATAGNRGQATAGNEGQATAGYMGQATVGDHGQATTGDYGQATAGNGGQATAGNWGQATAGYMGQATAGDWGQAIAGRYGQARAGESGTIILSYWDGNKYRTVVGYIGEDGLKPNVFYRLNNNHTFEEVK